jgi:hypothetical protein
MFKIRRNGRSEDARRHGVNGWSEPPHYSTLTFPDNVKVE